MPTIGWIALGVAALPVLYVVAAFNRLVAYRNEVRNAWAQIDVQLKRRHDLVPELVEVVKGIMRFERDVLEEIASVRASAVAASASASASDEGPRIRAEGRLTSLIGEVLGVWEKYPELKSDKNARDLQDQLAATENRIAYTRTHYNDVTANYNTLVEQFPSSAVAATFGFRKHEFFRAADDEKRTPGASLG